MHPCSMMPKCVAGHQSGFPGMMGLQTQRQSKDGSIQSFEAFLPPISVVTCARASDLTVGSRQRNDGRPRHARGVDEPVPGDQESHHFAALELRDVTIGMRDHGHGFCE